MDSDNIEWTLHTKSWVHVPLPSPIPRKIKYLHQWGLLFLALYPNRFSQEGVHMVFTHVTICRVYSDSSGDIFNFPVRTLKSKDRCPLSLLPRYSLRKSYCLSPLRSLTISSTGITTASQPWEFVNSEKNPG